MTAISVNKNTNIQLSTYIDCKKNIRVIAALITGLVMVVFGLIISSGLWGGGSMFFYVSACGIASIVCFVLAKIMIEGMEKEVDAQVTA
jgi:hypothetical protein